jgi:hypothetical protein
MRVLFVADYFVDFARDPHTPFVGGAEQTDAAVIAACPFSIERACVADLGKTSLGQFDLLVVGNVDTAKPEDCDALVRHGRHVLFEHDYRMCRWRGNHVHSFWHRLTDRCLCRQTRFGKLFETALGAIFLTRRQRARYEKNPFLRLPPTEVLGCSVMGTAFFEAVRRQREHPLSKHGTVVVHATSPHKGYAAALAHCHELGIEPTIVREASQDELLEKLARAERLVFLPAWHEPASRLAVEARFLGCELVTNDRLGVAGESWWSEPDEVGLEVLRSAPDRFWRLVETFARASRSHAPSPRAASVTA